MRRKPQVVSHDGCSSVAEHETVALETRVRFSPSVLERSEKEG